MATRANTTECGSRNGSIALVTGANSGIGRSVAEELVGAGWLVGALDVSTSAIPAGCTALAADLTQTTEVNRAVEDFGAREGRIDLLVNNAGISFVGTIEEGTEDDWRRVFEVNVFGQMRVVRAALPWLRSSASASIVIMSSCSALNGIPDRALYSASKGAVQALGHALATDLVSEGIRVNCISPGTVNTPFISELIARDPDPPARRRTLERRQPTGRMIDPGEIARAVLYLADQRNSSITGTTLVIDGGMGTIRMAPLP